MTGKCDCIKSLTSANLVLDGELIGMQLVEQLSQQAPIRRQPSLGSNWFVASAVWQSENGFLPVYDGDGKRAVCAQRRPQLCSSKNSRGIYASIRACVQRMRAHGAAARSRIAGVAAWTAATQRLTPSSTSSAVMESGGDNEITSPYGNALTSKDRSPASRCTNRWG